MSFALHPALVAAAAELLAACRARGWRVVTAESCTGGLVGAALTALPGSSEVMERGFVTYSNEAKSEMLGVDAALIALEGAVSGPVAEAMAGGALRASRADLALSITGVAGPGGGSAEKPVGTVWLGVARRDGWVGARRYGFPGDRDAVRAQAAMAGMEMLAVNCGG